MQLQGARQRSWRQATMPQPQLATAGRSRGSAACNLRQQPVQQADGSLIRQLHAKVGVWGGAFRD